jgi:hypothetical protein
VLCQYPRMQIRRLTGNSICYMICIKSLIQAHSQRTIAALAVYAPRYLRERTVGSRERRGVKSVDHLLRRGEVGASRFSNRNTCPAETVSLSLIIGV